MFTTAKYFSTAPMFVGVIALGIIAFSPVWANGNNNGGGNKCLDVEGMYIGEQFPAGQVDTGRAVTAQRFFLLGKGGSFITYELQAISLVEPRGSVSTPALGSWVCKDGVAHAVAFEAFAYGTDLADFGGRSLVDRACVRGDNTSCRQWAEFDRWSFKFNFSKAQPDVEYFLIGILQSDDSGILDKNVPQTIGSLNDDRVDNSDEPLAIKLRKLDLDGDRIREIVECDLTRITDKDNPLESFGYSPNCP